MEKVNNNCTGQLGNHCVPTGGQKKRPSADHVYDFIPGERQDSSVAILIDANPAYGKALVQGIYNDNMHQGKIYSGTSQ